MNRIPTDPELLIPTAGLDETANTGDYIPTGALWPTVRKQTSQLSHAAADHEILIVIPTYNQAQWLTELVRHLLRLRSLDILIVDDASTDGTGQVAEQLALHFPGQVDIMHQPERLGTDAAYTDALGYALKEGYTILFSLEGDFSEQPFPAPVLRYVLNETGIVLSTVAQIPTRSRSFWRRLFPWGKR